jgi:hypothetical protein
MSEEATLRIIFLREVFPLFWNLRIFSRLRWRFSFFAFTRHASREVVEVLTTPKVGAGAKAYEWQEWSLGEWRFGYKSCTQWGLTKDVQKKEMVQVDQFLLNVHAVGNVKSCIWCCELSVFRFTFFHCEQDMRCTLSSTRERMEWCLAPYMHSLRASFSIPLDGCF